MNSLIKFISAGAFALMLAGSFSACSTTSDDRYPSSTKEGSRLGEKKFRFKGTVMRHRDGDYYTIKSDSGAEYYAIDLPRAYKKNGLRVQVVGETRGYAKGGEYRALDIFDIAAL